MDNIDFTSLTSRNNYRKVISYEEKPIMSKQQYKFLEFRCKTEVTDEDMLRLLIDQALKDGDKERFLELSQQLNHHIAERDE